ncbi:PRELI domain containing 1b isoform X1 [Haplochromis burtoni]|uniref:PRELI domain-containing protein 1, mitochondrial-like n=1 Tax=Haplochromis burtoni TaxID=8153 RepID=A0A3Q2WPD3_HAPBU|nr:PRELI domain containing 1b isoform X1 [Haplochromis burtoni]XP_042084453.1 PRELI domain containing 1b isoform X1 [Haplochromis burtoni]XP_042084454.1 PRELI domain containing 1b isoform X1 [Haplochromis burtoni]
MVKYFCSSTDIRSTWDHVVSAFWQRYPNPFSTHVLTEDVVYREVTADHRLLSRRLLMKTNRLPRWAERLFPAGMSRSVYIIEDSIVDPVNKSLTTYTWNLNHTTLMSVEERCVFQGSVEHPATTQLKREAWISSSIYGFSKPIQEFGLARFKSNQVKAMKGLEYALSNLQGMYTSCVFQLKQGREQEEKQRKTKQLIFNCCHFWKGGKLKQEMELSFRPRNTGLLS